MGVLENIGWIDLTVFVSIIVFVIGLGLWKSHEPDGQTDVQDFFLAGRGLSWWLIGFSLIAANISTEQFVGMSGAAASHLGLAIASYEWLAAITLTIVAFYFLPYFLRAGIYTMPEFLEYRFNSAARFIMAAVTVAVYVLLIGAVTLAGAQTVKTLAEVRQINIELWVPAAFIVVVAMVYVVAGGLKASVWADLLQGGKLIIGGAIILWIGLHLLGEAETATHYVQGEPGNVEVVTLDPDHGAWERFMDLNGPQLNMFLPWDDAVIPWTALLLGLWIPNFYYWGLNQFITQRTLGSASLAEGQKGIVFAAYLKLLIPFVVVLPGMLAFNLYAGKMQLNAREDVGKAMALYLKAKPDTQFVSTQADVTDEAITAHVGPKYLIALYPTPERIKEVKAVNAFVLPMTQANFDSYKIGKYQLFEAREDMAWKYVNSELAKEVSAYNDGVKKAAIEANELPTIQALTAYKYDTALGLLLGMLPKNRGLIGLVMAALLGALMSALAAMLNAAASIFTLDLFAKFVAPKSSSKTLVMLGRGCVIVFGVAAFLLVRTVKDPNFSNSIFTVIQGVQGMLSPGVLAVFVFGLIFRRAPRICGVAGLVTNMIVYGGLWYLAKNTLVFEGWDFMHNFLNWMAISFIACLAVLTTLTVVAPLKEPVVFATKTDLDLRSSPGAFKAGMVCIAITVTLYVIFSPLFVAAPQ